LALLIRYPIAAIPLERDEGEYAYIAQQWLEGDVPYKDSFDQKPPGVFLAYAVLIRVFGTRPASLHWGAQVYTLGTLTLLWLLGRALFSPPAGLVAAVLGGFLTANHSMLGNAANTETFMLLSLSGAMWACLRALHDDSPRWSLVCGAFSASAVLFKQPALINLVFAFLLLLGLTRRRWLHTSCGLIGAAAVLSPVIVYFISVGAWREFYDCTIGHNLAYAGRVPLRLYPHYCWGSFRSMLPSTWPILLLAGFGMAMGLARPGPDGPPARIARKKMWIIGAWLVFSFMGVAMGGYFREHYFMQAIPPVALLAGFGASRIALPASLSVLGRSLPLSIAGAVVLYGVTTAPWYYLPGSADEKCRIIYGRNPFVESLAVGSFLVSHSKPDETVFVFGSEPQILYYAKRRSASRYIFVYPLMTPFPDTADRQASVIRELANRNPKFVVTIFIPQSFLAQRGTPIALFDSLRDLLSRSYHVVGVVPRTQAGRSTLVTGEEAEKLWQNSPIWYDKTAWSSLAIWQRSDPATEPPE